MTTTTIKATLTPDSINNVIKILQTKQKSLAVRAKLLTQLLAEVGGREASVRFASAIYDGTNNTTVELEPIANGWQIKASGEAVCFIEFGAGVHHNGSEPYPKRPAQILKIGEYGKGQGKNDFWYFNDPITGKGRSTNGNPAAMPMYYASREVEAKIGEIVAEVFGK